MPRRESPSREVTFLTKILLTLMLCVGIASALTYAFETRLTRSALARQSNRLTMSHLTILSQAYLAQERSLDAIIRNLAGEVASRGLTAPGKTGELQAQLAISYSNRKLSLLELIDTRDGRRLAAAGTAALRDAPGDVIGLGAFDVSSHLLPATDGSYIQTVMAGGAGGDGRQVLAGGFGFNDAFAFDLRTQIGNLGHVVLVAGGVVAGTTLPERPTVPPGAGRNGLPRSPTTVKVGGLRALVVYTPVDFGPDGTPAGALGVALGDPTAPLDRSLGRERVLTSLALTGVALVLGWLLFRSLIRPLVDLSDTATRIAGGDSTAAFEVRGRDEVAVLARSLGRMTEESRAQAARITETSWRIVTAQDQERHRIERDLHDGAQQRLLTASLAVGVAMTAETARRDLQLAAQLDEAARHLNLALAELRELARGIYPSILGEEGLGPALESLVEKATIPATMTEPFVERLPAPIEATAYFIVSEAIANATKHARSSVVRIHASLVEGHLIVEVSDDGVGGADPTRGTGLVGLGDRVAALGGLLTVDSLTGKGTRIVAQLPCE